MQFGNREKIVVGSIAGLVTIAALHGLVFKPRADELAREKLEFLNQKNAISQLGQPKELLTIYRFQLANAEYAIQYFEALKDMNLAIPEHYTTKPDVEKQQADFRGEMEKLLALRGPEAKPKLTFLDEGKWDFPERLPDAVMAAGVDLGDKVRSIVNADEVIKVLPAGTPLRAQKEYEYKMLLRELSVDLDRVQFAIPQFGQSVKTMHILHRAKLIRNALPRDFEMKASLEELFRLEWPEQILNPVKQLQGLVDLIKMAREAGIEEISSVTLSPTLVVYPPMKGVTAPAVGGMVASAPGMGMSPYGAPGMGADPYGAPGMGASPYGAPGMGTDPYGSPYGGPGGGNLAEGMPGGEFGAFNPYASAPQQQVVSAELLGASAPIRIEFVGPNLNVMKFLHQITHSRRTYDVDYLAIKAMEETSGSVRVIANVVLITVAGTKLFSPEEVETELVKWRKTYDELSKRPAVRGGPDSTEPTPRTETPI